MSDRSWASSIGVRKSMQANTGRDTKPELALRRAVHALGLRYYVNRRPIKAVRRTADLLFPRLKLAVFLDGCFWHGCPEHHTIAKTNAAFWSQKVATNRRRDVDTNERLTAAGWTVIRIWEHEATTDAAARIAAAVTAMRRTPSDY
ncbi:very short patch repair endonuclease [Micromonospora aurantiaca (nom. illeg.)]|uniref:Very short patch repair endonuclease n=1 Tax=Micromonospora aurantiaca (nom. illeg.) TaxID=47850 RepID=A0A6N3JZN4_9ACTN|nr:very short patch repair endonuclease [Micromonospora aurantiaca]ADL45299.1 DNA mismatch endonuclease Vsr [Micromonospora aurantiaca ATCC 27029]AXH91418.1 very short patch repair endonuclease [Micromonospora aurantiaca]